MTEEQYNRLKEFKPAIDKFMSQGSFDGKDEGVLSIFDEITGGTVKRNCPSCIGSALLSCSRLIEEYERRDNI